MPPGITGEALFVGSRDGSVSTTTLPVSGECTIRAHQMGNAKSSGQRSNFRLAVRIAGAAQKSTASQASDDDEKMVAAYLSVVGGSTGCPDGRRCHCGRPCKCRRCACSGH